MGYGFGKNAQFEDWSALSSYSTKEDIDILESYPVPTGQKVELSNKAKGAVDLTTEFAQYEQMYPTIDFSAGILPQPVMLLFKGVLNKVKRNNKIYINFDDSDIKKKFIESINLHNTSTDYETKENAVKNSVVSRIKRVISMPSNQLLANEPVSIQVWHNGADEANKIYKREVDPLSPYDMLSMYKQQKDASIGKSDVGIGANGLKALFALNNYYNTWLDSKQFTEGDLRISPYSFRKTLYMNTKEDGKLVKKFFNIQTISDTKTSKAYLSKIQSDYKYRDFGQQLTVLNSLAALATSAFVSGATDNAKELVMAKINAIENLAGMHMYMLSLGFTAEQVSIFMNSDLANYIVKNISVNIFDSTQESLVTNLIAEYARNYKKVNKEIPAEVASEIDTFKDIYEGAQEFRALSGILKVNQKTSANMNSLNNFFNSLESAMYTREHFVLGDNLKDLKLFGNDLQDITEEQINNLYEHLKASDKRLVDMIMIANSSFREMGEKGYVPAEDLKNYVAKVLFEASHIPVHYLNSKRESALKEVSLIGGEFDFRYYIQDENDLYREATIKYYNLFKNTINIFHVLENSPHFRAMVDGLKTTHNMLNIVSKKYNFIFSSLRDIVRENSVAFRSANSGTVKSILGNTALPIRIDDVVIGRALVAYDKFLTSKWLVTGHKASKFTFDVRALLKMANLSEVKLYKDDRAKTYSTSELDQSINQDKLITVDTRSSTPFVIDLKTDTGIANFKILMEEVLFETLKRSGVALSDSLMLTTIRNPFGIFTAQITPTFPISQLNSPVNAAKFQTLINDFNDVDSKVSPEFVVRNSNNSKIPWKDLFYVYNLIVNNESYGDKRLTPLFEDYIKDPEAIANEFLHFSSVQDQSDENVLDIYGASEYIEDIEADVKAKEATAMDYKQKLINNILFLAYHKQGHLNLLGEGGVTLANSNYPIITEMVISKSQDKEKFRDIKNILSVLKNKNLIITYNCE